jgi:RNA polymerase sigma-70 factor (ECF subfamily)
MREQSGGQGVRYGCGVDDVQLVRALLAGDEGAFFELRLLLEVPSTAGAAGRVDLDALQAELDGMAAAAEAGDEGAFMELVRTYRPSMLRVALMYVPSVAVAEEVVQEAFLGLLTGLARFEGRSSFKTWLFRILTNIAKTRGEREGRTLPFSALRDPGRVPEPAVEAERFLDAVHPRWPGHWASRPRPWGEPEERLLAGEARGELARAIEALPPTQRAVITMRDLNGWSADEVCNALGISETNQRVLLHRARAKVRRGLEDHLR